MISYPTRQGKLPQARMLVRHGYGVLLLDARGYDGSQGDPNLFGWAGEKDIDAAVAWLRRRPDVESGPDRRHRILRRRRDDAPGRGLQPGAACGRLGGSRLRARCARTCCSGPRGWLALPEAALQTAAVAVMSGTAPPPALDDLVRRIAPRPTFLIYAGHGVDSEELNVDYHRAASAPKVLWKIAEARHVGGFQARPGEYEERVTRFFDQALLGEG